MIEGEFLAEFGIVAMVVALIPASIAKRKGRNGVVWWILGVLFFLPVLIGALVMRDPTDDIDPHIAAGRTTLCPGCREPVKPDASRCRWCQADIGDTAEAAAVG